MADDNSSVAKIATLEADVRHLTQVVERLTPKVEELIILIERMRGAMWVVSTIAGGVGFVAAKVVSSIPWTSVIPR